MGVTHQAPVFGHTGRLVKFSKIRTVKEVSIENQNHIWGAFGKNYFFLLEIGNTFKIGKILYVFFKTKERKERTKERKERTKGRKAMTKGRK